MDSTKDCSACECARYSRALVNRLKGIGLPRNATLDFIDQWVVRAWELADIVLKSCVNGHPAFTMEVDPGEYPSRMGSGAIPTRKYISEIPTRLIYRICLPASWIDDTIMVVSSDNLPISLAAVLRDSNMWEILVNEFWVMAGLVDACKETGERPLDVRGRFNIIIDSMGISERHESGYVVSVDFTIRAEPK